MAKPVLARFGMVLVGFGPVLADHGDQPTPTFQADLPGGLDQEGPGRSKKKMHVRKQKQYIFDKTDLGYSPISIINRSGHWN